MGVRVWHGAKLGPALALFPLQLLMPADSEL